MASFSWFGVRRAKRETFGLERRTEARIELIESFCRLQRNVVCVCANFADRRGTKFAENDRETGKLRCLHFVNKKLHEV